MDKRLAEWLDSGDTGTSSKAIMLWMSAGHISNSHGFGPDTPSDPSDLGRCLRLLERFPEWKPRMPEMAKVGGLWPTFATRWDEMATSMEAEVGIRWEKGQSAPKTYELMKQIETVARSANKERGQRVDVSPGVSMRFA